jgi:hypothetical protein
MRHVPVMLNYPAASCSSPVAPPPKVKKVDPKESKTPCRIMAGRFFKMAVTSVYFSIR